MPDILASAVRRRPLACTGVCLSSSIALLAFVAIAGAAQADETKPTTAPTTAAASPATSTATSPATPQPPPPELSEDERALWRNEEAFAASFAARDPEKFASFLADDALFVGANRMLRGKQQVLEAWTKMMMAGPVAPFSWRPSRSMVTGNLGSTAGPVFDPSGKWTGAFTSTWRRDPDGKWRVVLDSAPPCQAPRDPAP